MRSQRNIARQLFGLTLTLVGLLSWHILPIPHPELAVQAANRAKVAEPTGQAVSSAVANGRVAFVSSEGNARADIYTMEADGSNVQRLTNNPAYDQGPKWSPDGTKIAFASSRDDTSVRCASGGGCWFEIYVMNPDGTNQTRTNNRGFDDSFDWSPDSTRIVFESFHDGSIGSISIMNVDGSNVQRLTNYPGYDYSPKWSPDGTKIAFLRADDNFASISVMNADGTNQTRLSNLTGYDSRWSPDGTKIVFVSADIFDATTQEIYVMNADGSNVQRLTNNQTGDSNPAWSPDGSKITFTRACQHNRCPTQQPPHIWVVNADGSNPTQLTDILAYGSAWSPDGTKIIFGGPDSGAADLFVMNPDGGGLTNITNTDGKWETSPSWQPLSLPPVVNPIDEPQFFVRQHYLDFLNREPDQAGYDYWVNQITQCATDLLCVHHRRIGVSGAFFVELEFQRTGYVVYRMHRAAFGTWPNTSTRGNLTAAQFFADRPLLTEGADLAQSTINFANSFVQRPAFLQVYPTSLTNAEFVNKLFDMAELSPYTIERQQQIDAMNNAGKTRAQVLLDVIEISEFKTREYNRAFVLMQYFGYLRRDPDQNGYDFWLNILNNREPNNYRGMICAFLTSEEYQRRFGTIVTRSNADCSQWESLSVE
jgi:Tol biopolymer transport system component